MQPSAKLKLQQEPILACYFKPCSTAVVLMNPLLERKELKLCVSYIKDSQKTCWQRVSDFGSCSCESSIAWVCTPTPGCAAPEDSLAGGWEPPALWARLHWAANGRLPGPHCAGMMGLALQSQQSLVLALLELVAEAHLARDCPAQGRTTSCRRAANTPPGPVPTACRAVSSPLSKSVTHGASHIPQLQEIQKASAPALFQPHMPPPCLTLKYFSCSRASLLLPSFQPGRKPPSPLSSQLWEILDKHHSSLGCNSVGNAWPTASVREGLTWWQVVTSKGRRFLTLAMHTSEKRPQSVIKP